MPPVANSAAKPLIGIIADDLTGAAELAGVAWRFGFTAEIQTGEISPTDAEIIAVDTDSRLCNSAEAARRVTNAARQLRVLGVGWIYKKVDSVLRGPVLAEVDAALAALQLNRALLVSANPGLGRVVRDGKYFIHDVPVHETDFRNDPQYPRTSARVLDMLGQGGARPVAVCRPEQLLPAAGVIVGEAAASADLSAWATKLDATMLPVGAAEFFAAILAAKAALKPPQSKRVANQESLGSPTLFVCGSMAASAKKFLADCRQRGLPVLPLPPEALRPTVSPQESVAAWTREISAALARQPQVVVTIGEPFAQVPPARLTELLVAAVASVLRTTTVAQINAEGGATAAALMQAMGWNRLRVLREVSPGVVTLRVGQGGGIAFTMKPGSYVWPDAIISAR